MKKKIALIITILLLVSTTFYGYSLYKGKVAEANMKEIKMNEEAYSKILASVLVDIENGFEFSEKLVDEYSSAWSDAIYGTKRDFDIALQKEVAQNKESGKLIIIGELDKDIKENLKSATDVPDTYEKLYKNILELHEDYSRMKNYALEPSGSLVEFNKDINSIKADYESTLDQVEVLKSESFQEEIDTYKAENSSRFTKMNTILSKQPEEDLPNGYDWVEYSEDEKNSIVLSTVNHLEEKGYTFPSYITQQFLVTGLEAFYDSDSTLRLKQIHGITVEEKIIKMLDKY